MADEEKAEKDSYNLIGQQMFGTADFKDAVWHEVQNYLQPVSEK